jgi:phage I-like protein
MVDYAALKAEIAKPDYAGMSDAQIVAALNAKTVASPLPLDVPVASVEAYLSLAGVLTAIEDWLQANAAPSAARTAARELLRTIASPHVTSFEMSKPATFAAVQNMLGALEQVALLSAQQASDLLALASPPVPWRGSIGWQTLILVADLANARAA